MYIDSKVNIQEFFESKSILITGACGTIGRGLAKQLLTYNLAGLRLLDNDDTAITELQDELENHNNEGILRFLIGTIRDKERLVRAFEGIDYVFHCAALKHVAIGEYNPREVILTNVNGTENVIEAALHNNIKKVIYTSSDKAVNPVNTMGASKLLGEKLIVAANYVRGSKQTNFSTVRFGNVLGSRGSIIRRFEKRVKKGLPLIVTDPKMTRFMMPINDAINLTLRAMVLSNGGEIFVLKMPSLILGDLIDLFLEHAKKKFEINPDIEITGLFPGEKSYEELMTEEELTRAIETNSMYIVLPHIKELLEKYPKEILDQRGKIKSKANTSQLTDPISKSDLRRLLTKINLINGS
ncbi:MAG: SDR family NAD(P)-dependent oxidoreductase [Promethearchaeota archaeon]